MPNKVNKGAFRGGGGWGGGGGRGGTHPKVVEAVKRLDRLAPNLVHICGFVWEWT